MQRVGLRVLRSLGIGIWRLGERLGVNLVGAIEAPRTTTDAARRASFEGLIASARAGDGTVDLDGCPYPVHELLTYLVDEHGLLLHGSNHTTLEVLEPQPARDADTTLLAVVACDDGIWPLFYAVVARDRVDGVITACTHLGRGARRRRFYVLALHGGVSVPSAVTNGVVYALPRDGFRREWGNEWVSSEPVRPALRIPVRPADLPLLDDVVALSTPTGFRSVLRELRAAKRAKRERKLSSRG
jgi:hypothetical protein